MSYLIFLCFSFQGQNITNLHRFIQTFMIYCFKLKSRKIINVCLISLQVAMYSSYDIPGRFVALKDYKKLYTVLNTFFITSTESVRNLFLWQRKCLFFTENKLQLTRMYSFNRCVMEFRMNKAQSICNCTPHVYLISGIFLVNIQGL